MTSGPATDQPHKDDVIGALHTACDFDTPTLRGIFATPPYFHDGSAPTLSEAVKTMGLAQLDRLLTDQQIAAIVTFLNTLTGTYQGQAVAPATGNPGANTAPP